MEVGHWNLAETKEKQKKAAEKRRRESAIVIGQAKNAENAEHGYFGLVFKV